MNQTKNIIKVWHKDTIMDIVSKSLLINGGDVFLDFPLGHPVLHNYLSLKILRNKLEWKRITIITNDLISKKIGSPLWINFIIKKDEVVKAPQEEVKKIIWNKKYYSNLIKNKLAIASRLLKESMVNNIKYESPKDTLKKRNIILTISWVAFSISMLLFIFYFAVNKTYIYIEPEIEIQKELNNITFVDLQDWENVINKNTIKLIPYSKTVTTSESYKGTQIDYATTKPAKWRLKVVNETFEDKYFRPNTRFVTTEGIVFNTTDWETIPAAKKWTSWEKINWEKFVYIEAKTFDEAWDFIWERWNIIPEEPIFLTIPGLKNDKDKIYWILEEETFWWTNDFSMMISEDDLKRAESKTEEKVRKLALDELKFEIKEKNELNWTNLEIFLIKDIISYSNLKIENIDNIEAWSKKEEFIFKWSITLNTYLYDKSKLISYLERKINEWLLSWVQKLAFINENSLKFVNIVTREEEQLKIKATTEVEIWINYNFDNKDNSRVKKLKYLVLWLESDKAANILLNDPKVNNVIIENSPFFVKKVSSLPENITIEIKK